MLRYEFLFLLLSLAFVEFLVSGDAARIPRTTLDAAATKKCGYEACHAIDPKKLNIHMVSHTHDDVGWLKTVDQYYFGSRSTIQKAGVQYILDSVIKALLADPSRRFIYVETAFFWKWWLRQDDKVRNDVKMLVNEGRLEFIGGAWSMNDEACTHYHSLVDQFTWGFRRLNDTFGSCARPHIGWQIDPFGHSREQASLFAQMGFDGMLFGRIDYQDKSTRLNNQTMEFIWKSSPSLGKRANLFTTAMFNNYSPPPGFCFDVLCADEPMIDDPDSPDYNIDRKIDDFLRYAVTQANYYRTNHIILTMGGDFTYQHAEMYFMNLDKLIRYTNKRNGSMVNVIYSTPSCYLKALNDLNLQWPTKSDDFFPYASDPHSFWTGYFSSRPTVKYLEREGNNLLQASKQLVALTNLKKYDKPLEHFREAMGVMQHHDAVTGTEKQLVADDYSRILSESMDHAEEIISKAIEKWSGIANSTATSFKIFTCLELNISSCSFSEQNDMFMVVVYNPLSRPVSTYVRVPVQGNSYVVRSLTDGVYPTAQIVPIPQTVQKIPGRKSNAINEVVFRALNIPPLGILTYAIAKKTQEQVVEQPQLVNFISNELYNISVETNGNLAVRWNKQNMRVVQSFHYYIGAEGNNEVFANRSSGAYIFRPKETSARNFAYSGSYKIYKGPVVEELQHKINEWISQVVRVYPEEEHVEFEWLVGPIPIKDKIGKEILTRYSSNLQTDKTFYTDSNGREMLKRVRNYRSTWNLDLKEPISGNYYPVTSKIALKDENKQLKLNVLVDRAQGGSSLQDGAVELMLHRRLLKDDAFGVAEALNETAFGEGLVVRGTHYLFGGKLKNTDEFVLKEKELALKLALHPWILGASVNLSNIENVCAVLKNFTSGLNKALPPNVHILTLEPWKDDTILLRLEHLFEVGEAQRLSQPVEIDIQNLFSMFSIESIKETTLGANQLLSENKPMQWKLETNDVIQDEEVSCKQAECSLPEVHDNIINILLKPMEIRTFILKVKRIPL
ncbi:PREDICTED: lysosomal alpha-mannosidase isoform X1 [Wasmannia auropunctata]|uniref:lysosomal alpha-mannosidase isoform X1 n=1 Tax=Wasmannia auropunctata TaxID=64793 RepID=UPI0005EF38E3|nr:PREDICTED: lysosomal alpha-mannosidase isoform X1 [Wasmannia auropunctata]XP_011704649.1 PREDICTED: lysosomal alpha-mannosidase isoform X1 [Wasmannia auropunctata]XP_011704659.1 PREDICTED: lysosomal alpha-mannosidase isoform X1 [Wasmannia auropunctata]